MRARCRFRIVTLALFDIVQYYRLGACTPQNNRLLDALSMLLKAGFGVAMRKWRAAPSSR
jgi:hypothetical protein